MADDSADDVQTGRPKGVVTRHSALTAQVSALVDAWRWTRTVSCSARMGSRNHIAHVR